MRRDLLNVVVVMLVSTTVAAAANVLAHKMDWIRMPLDREPIAPVVQSTPGTPRAPSSSQQANLIGLEIVIQHLTNATACFIDAREPAEYAAGHLRGALNIPSSAVYAEGDKVRSLVGLDTCVIVYCGGGGCEASHNVSDALRRDFEFKNVLIYEKGWEEIQSSGRLNDFIVTGDQP